MLLVEVCKKEHHAENQRDGHDYDPEFWLQLPSHAVFLSVDPCLSDNQKTQPIAGTNLVEEMCFTETDAIGR